MPLDVQQIEMCGLKTLKVEGDPDGPVVILFHGFGADAYDLLPLSQVYKERPKATWLFPHGPLEIEIAPGYTGRAWFEIDLERIKRAIQMGQKNEVNLAFPPDLQEARRIGTQLIAELNIPLSKLFLGGFSQGAVLAADIGLNAFEKVGGLILLSGTLIHEPQWERLAHQHAGMPFFQSHGQNDPILPYERAQALEKILKGGGLKGKLHTFAGGHEIPPPILTELRNFLTKQLQPA